MTIQNYNLNIHYSAPDEVWLLLENLYKEMPFWSGETPPTWRDEEGHRIEVSVEPSGLQFYSELPDEEWEKWFTLFKKRATELLGYKIGELEEGYSFYYWG